MTPSHEVLGTLTLLYLVIAVHSSYTNTTFNRPPTFDPKLPPNKTLKKEPQDNRQRHGRIFNFSDKDNKIDVELGFTIPFISIPIKGMNDDGTRPLVDINVGTLTAGAILTTAALIFIPKAFSGLEPQISFGRSSDDDDKSGFLYRVNRSLREQNIDPAVCTQRAVCWMVKSSVARVAAGEGSSTDKIIDGISSNNLLERMVHGTGIEEAIHNGRRNKDCSLLYYKCPVTQEFLQRIATNFMRGIV